MSNVVKITSISTKAGNKKITPDSDGYYLVTLGALNVRNHSGDIYLFRGFKDAVERKGSVFERRMSTGRLRGEADHPKFETGMSRAEFVMRNLDISNKEVCMHIKEINIIETNSSENIPGVGNIVLVKGLIKPTGAYGDGLKESLDNPAEDTCFSIRSFTKDKAVGTNFIKVVNEVVTWDWVGSPGIKYASTLNSPTVEAHTICECELQELIDLEPARLVANESSDVRDLISDISIQYSKEDALSVWSS